MFFKQDKHKTKKGIKNIEQIKSKQRTVSMEDYEKLYNENMNLRTKIQEYYDLVGSEPEDVKKLMDEIKGMQEQYYKLVETNKIIKEAYSNMLDEFKKFKNLKI